MDHHDRKNRPNVTYRQLRGNEICPSLFSHFNRYQNVTHCWRKEQGKWIVKNIAFVEQWSDQDYQQLAAQLAETAAQGGAVVGAFEHDSLIGFASVENDLFGSRRQYLQLSNLHVSCEFRGQGIGTALFGLAVRAAAARGAEKLYLSAHSSVETQRFYHRIGCVEAQEYHERLAQKEPCDCQMEFDLDLT